MTRAPTMLDYVAQAGSGRSSGAAGPIGASGAAGSSGAAGPIWASGASGPSGALRALGASLPLGTEGAYRSSGTHRTHGSFAAFGTHSTNGTDRTDRTSMNYGTLPRRALMSDTVALATEFGASRKANKNKKQTERTDGETSRPQRRSKEKAREAREEQGLIKLGSVNPAYGMIPKNEYPFFEVRPRFATERIKILNELMGLALATTITEFEEDGDELNMKFIRTMKAKAKEAEKKRQEIEQNIKREERQKRLHLLFIFSIAVAQYRYGTFDPKHEYLAAVIKEFVTNITKKEEESPSKDEHGVYGSINAIAHVAIRGDDSFKTLTDWPIWKTVRTITTTTDLKLRSAIDSLRSHDHSSQDADTGQHIEPAVAEASAPQKHAQVGYTVSPDTIKPLLTNDTRSEQISDITELMKYDTVVLGGQLEGIKCKKWDSFYAAGKSAIYILPNENPLPALTVRAQRHGVGVCSSQSKWLLSQSAQCAAAGIIISDWKRQYTYDDTGVVAVIGYEGLLKTKKLTPLLAQIISGTELTKIWYAHSESEIKPHHQTVVIIEGTGPLKPTSDILPGKSVILVTEKEKEKEKYKMINNTSGFHVYARPLDGKLNMVRGLLNTAEWEDDADEADETAGLSLEGLRIADDRVKVGYNVSLDAIKQLLTKDARSEKITDKNAEDSVDSAHDDPRVDVPFTDVTIVEEQPIRAVKAAAVAVLEDAYHVAIDDTYNIITDISDIDKYDTVSAEAQQVDNNIERWKQWLVNSGTNKRALFVVYDDMDPVPASIAGLRKLATERKMGLWRLQPNVFGIYNSNNVPVGIKRKALPKQEYNPKVLLVGKTRAPHAVPKGLIKGEPATVGVDASEVKIELPHCDTIIFDSESALDMICARLEGELRNWLKDGDKTILVLMQDGDTKIVMDLLRKIAPRNSNDTKMICTRQYKMGNSKKITVMRLGAPHAEWQSCESVTDYDHIPEPPVAPSDDTTTAVLDSIDENADEVPLAQKQAGVALVNSKKPSKNAKYAVLAAGVHTTVVEIKDAALYNTVIITADSIPKEISDTGFFVDTLVFVTNISISRLAGLARKKQKRMWIKRVDQEIVVCICDDIKDSADINQEGWTPASETTLVYEAGEAAKAGGAAKASGAGGAGGADAYTIKLANGDLSFRMTLAAPSDDTKSIRRAGIQAAVDYIAAVYASRNAREKAKMCLAKTEENPETRAVMSPIQELVYLTVGVRPGNQQRAVRIYAFAPGSGKSKAMAIALLDAAKNAGGSGSTCLVLNEKSAYENLVLEIMRAMVDRGDRHVIKLHQVIQPEKDGAISNESLQELHEKWDDRLSVLKKLADTYDTSDDMRRDVLDETTKMLQKARIHVVYISTMNEAATKNIIAGCSCMVADECHEVMGRIAEATSCTRFYGFSATPFNKKADIETLMRWTNRSSDMEQSDEQLAAFVKAHVCLADGGDVRALLPYANLGYNTLIAECGIPAEQSKSVSVYEVNITNEGKTEKYFDIDRVLYECEYNAAVEKMVEVLNNLTVTRVFIYLQTPAMLLLFKDRVKSIMSYGKPKFTFDLSDDAYEPQLRILIDEPAGTTKHSSDERIFFNTINEGAYEKYRAVVTTSNYQSVEYMSISRTYIVGIPDAYVCEQARNRAFRMCSHHSAVSAVPVTKKKLKKGPQKGETDVDTADTGPDHAETGPDHEIFYVLVQRKNEDITLTRGSYALARAHPKKKQESDVTNLLKSASRLDIPTKDYRADGIEGEITNDPGEIRTYKEALGMDEKKLGEWTAALTVFDLYGMVTKKKTQQADVRTYDDRIRRMLGNFGRGVTISFNESSKSAVHFDSGNNPLRAYHHNLNGLRFELKSRDEFKTEKIEAGDVVLHYGKGDKGVEKLFEDAKNSAIFINSATSVYNVAMNARRAFYVDAHRIQCLGHARFECFRVFPEKNGSVERFFVGDTTEFEHFVGMLSRRDIYDGKCLGNTQKTPMMIAVAVRRMLLKKNEVKIDYKGDYAEKICEYLTSDLQGWSLKCEERNDGDAGITINGTVIKQGDLVNQHDYGKYEPKSATGVLVVCRAEQLPQKSSFEKLHDLTTVDLRGLKGKYTSAPDDLANVRCEVAVFVDNKPVGYAAARVVADKYVIMTSQEFKSEFTRKDPSTKKQSDSAPGLDQAHPTPGHQDPALPTPGLPTPGLPTPESPTPGHPGPTPGPKG